MPSTRLTCHLAVYRKAVASFERRIADACYAIRDCYTLKAGAIHECIIGDAGDAIGYRDARQAGTT